MTAKINPNMMALHSGSQVFVRKDDILKIFCDKPALYAVRLAALVFGEETLRNSKMSEDNDPKFAVLDEEILESIISESGIFFSIVFTNMHHFFSAHVIQVFKQQNKSVSRGAVKNSIRMRLRKSHKH